MGTRGLSLSLRPPTAQQQPPQLLAVLPRRLSPDGLRSCSHIHSSKAESSLFSSFLTFFFLIPVPRYYAH